MARQKRDTKAILKTIERSEQRSTLFWWLVEHHDEMIAAAKKQRILWRTFCAKAAARGLTDTRGQPPTERGARETWMQARKEVAAARSAAAGLPPQKINPSRIDKNWRPANAPPPTNQLVPAAAGAHPLQELMPAIRKNPADKDDGYDPKARKASLLRLIAQRSGH
jgi:hypothetical protein